MLTSDVPGTYKATQNFVLRMPMRYRHEFTSLITYHSVLEALPAMLADPYFKLALQVSSPSLVEQLDRLMAKPVDLSNPRIRRALRSLRKYLIRMTRRSTPFGLLSGAAVGRFGDMSNMKPSKVTSLGTSYEWDTRWVCLDIFGGLENLDAVVGLDLTELCASTRSLAPMWFFIRYSIPAHRLRIRLRVDSVDNIGFVRTVLLEWAHRLLERSLIYDYSLVSFVPEINRFGGDAVYEQALSVFSVSSELARFISHLRVKGMCAGISDEMVGMFILASCQNSMKLTPRELVPFPSKEKEFREYYRLHRQDFMDILSCVRIKGLDDANQAKLRELSSVLDTAMAKYSTALAQQRMSPVRYRSVFASIIHMIFNRTFLIGNAVEQRTLDLWALTNDAYERRMRALAEDKE